MTRWEDAQAPAVSLAGVTKSYGGFTLGPVHLTLEPGYVSAIVGPNGSGKTTLFRLLMGLSRPDDGEVRLLGGRLPEDEVEVKRKVGYVPERAVGHDDLTAGELGLFVSRWYPEWDEACYRRLVERFEVDPKTSYAKLSRGTQKRLSFAAALACRPKLLLLDEPTDGVDPIARRTMLDEISAFADDPAGGRAVLLATHDMEEVRRIADYVAFLAKGRFLGLHEKDSLLASWRAFWVEKVPHGNLPGVTSAESGAPVRLVSDAPRETRAALEERGVGVLKSAPLELDEILTHLVRREGSP